MERRLYALYTHQVGRDKATKAGFVVWLEQVVAWLEDYARKHTDVDFVTDDEFYDPNVMRFLF